MLLPLDLQSTCLIFKRFMIKSNGKFTAFTHHGADLNGAANPLNNAVT